MVVEAPVTLYGFQGGFQARGLMIGQRVNARARNVVVKHFAMSTELHDSFCLVLRERRERGKEQI